MFRKDGPIPQLERERFPRFMLVFDTEAFRGETINDLEIQTFRMAVTRFLELDKDASIKDDITEYHWNNRSLKDVIELHTHKDQLLYVYAHNVKYDLQLSGIMQMFLDDGWKVKQFVFDDPPTFIKMSRNRSSIIFVDTFNYWQTSLAKLGEQLGLPKLSIPDNLSENEQWKVYCKRDVDVLTEYLLTFIRYLKGNDLCGLGLTLASQSFRSYRHAFMHHEIILHSRSEVLALERQGYSGGRVEAFYIGQLPERLYFKLDVNSMYPYVMKEFLYPYEFVGYSENVTLDRLEDLLSMYYVIAECELNTDQAVYPFKQKHKLVFPVGAYKTVLHDREIHIALSRNQILAVPKIAIYRFGDLFTDYIDFFYNLKVTAEKSGDKVTRHQAKIMMNSLYGKFGQMNVISKITPNVTHTKYGRITGYSETLGTTVEVNCLGEEMEVSYKRGESAFSFPAIAGAVTAYARCYLYQLMETAGLDHVYYCDTDSLITDVIGLNNLLPFIDDHRLGALKIEEISHDVMIWGAKDYRYGTDIKHKGVPKNANERHPGEWEYQQFRGAKTWLSDGLNPDVHVSTRIKRRKSEYDKGTINPDNTVSPLRITV